MVNIDTVRAANATITKLQPLVAVFVGGTSGIGEYALRALASAHGTTGKGLRVYLVGRNATTGGKILDDCRKQCPGNDFRFVQAKDLRLLRDVDKTCAEMLRLEKEEGRKGGHARVDMLFMSQGLVLFGGRQETEEGLDATMSLLYYSRMRFITQLESLLQASTLPAHVVSVYAAGKESKLFQDDLSLRDPEHYSFANARSHIVYMKTLFMEALAEKHAQKLSMVHVFPSLVITPGFDRDHYPLWFKAAWTVAAPFAGFFSVSQEESGERTLFLASSRYPARGTTTAEAKDVAVGTDGQKGSGAYAVNYDGEVIPTAKAYEKVGGRAELLRKVWSHTMEAFGEIETGNAFTK